jgi:hypothetical protein
VRLLGRWSARRRRRLEPVHRVDELAEHRARVERLKIRRVSPKRTVDDWFSEGWLE